MKTVQSVEAKRLEKVAKEQKRRDDIAMEVRRMEKILKTETPELGILSAFDVVKMFRERLANLLDKASDNDDVVTLSDFKLVLTDKRAKKIDRERKRRLNFGEEVKKMAALLDEHWPETKAGNLPTSEVLRLFRKKYQDLNGDDDQDEQDSSIDTTSSCLGSFDTATPSTISTDGSPVSAKRRRLESPDASTSPTPSADAESPWGFWGDFAFWSVHLSLTCALARQEPQAPKAPSPFTSVAKLADLHDSQ